jgi:hypothetical protein
MTFEQGLIIALTGVVTALCFLFNLLWQRSVECEEWRAKNGPVIQEMAEQLGIHTGITRMVNTCNVTGCPYAGKLNGPLTFSIQKSETKNSHEKL